jgi:hypothetical protein
MNIKVEFKTPIGKIQKEFENQLSGKQILKTTAVALNETARKAIPQLKKEAKTRYTIDRKYLSKIAKITKPARGTHSGLYVELSTNTSPTPLIGFKHRNLKPMHWKRGMSGGVQIEVIKGKQHLLKHAFIATMTSGHTGIFQSGRYQGGKFVPGKDRTSSGKTRITELKSASPFSMIRNKDIEKNIQNTIQSQLPGRVRALLQQKVDKLKK